MGKVRSFLIFDLGDEYNRTGLPRLLPCNFLRVSYPEKLHIQQSLAIVVSLWGHFRTPNPLPQETRPWTDAAQRRHPCQKCLPLMGPWRLKKKKITFQCGWNCMTRELGSPQGWGLEKCAAAGGQRPLSPVFSSLFLQMKGLISAVTSPCKHSVSYGIHLITWPDFDKSH